MSWFLYGLIAALLIVGYSIYQMVSRALQMKALCHEGVLGTGTITKSVEDFTGSGLSRNYLRYEFTTPEGRKYTYRIAVGHAERERYPVGSPIDVIYLPEKPRISATREMVNQARGALKLPPL